MLNTPLIEYFEATTPIILNSKQLKNQKKKERKKKKKQGEKQDDEKEEEKEEPKSKTQVIVEEFRQKIDKYEEKYLMVPEMVKLRSISPDDKDMSAYKPMFRTTEEEEQMSPLERPPSIRNVIIHPLKINKHREYLRVNSTPKLWSQKMQTAETKPRTPSDVNKMKENDLQVKLCDMGNACYIQKHYSDIIQTREYRSPEVILGGEYDQSADIWSLACMVFELVTGDYLFDPKKGKTYRKNDDHLALITELIGPCYDRNYMETNSKIWKFYNKKNMKLKNISKLH